MFVSLLKNHSNIVIRDEDAKRGRARGATEEKVLNNGEIYVLLSFSTAVENDASVLTVA